MSSPVPSRTDVTASRTSIGVVIFIGDMQAAITLPVAPSGSQLSEDQARTAALRAARHALDVAREELDDEIGTAT